MNEKFYNQYSQQQIYIWSQLTNQISIIVSEIGDIAFLQTLKAQLEQQRETERDEGYVYQIGE